MGAKNPLDLRKYGTRWVAITSDRKNVIASSKKVETVFKKAKKQDKEFLIINASAYSGSYIL
jgi:hypothetical protein